MRFKSRNCMIELEFPLHGAKERGGVKEVTSNFAEGVNVPRMEIGIPWAMQDDSC